MFGGMVKKTISKNTQELKQHSNSAAPATSHQYTLTNTDRAMVSSFAGICYVRKPLFVFIILDLDFLQMTSLAQP